MELNLDSLLKTPILTLNLSAICYQKYTGICLNVALMQPGSIPIGSYFSETTVAVLLWCYTVIA